MSRFATDLLTYFRDLLIVKSGGDHHRQSPLFDDNLAVSFDQLFTMIATVTKHLPEIKKGTHPRIYAEMMTIQLAEQGQVTDTAIPSSLLADVDGLKHEISQLRETISQLQAQKV